MDITAALGAGSSADSVLAQFQRAQEAEDDAGETDFLELMIAQLNNQDPLNPQENGDFLAQLAQFSSLESMRNLEDGVASMTAAMTSGTALQAAGLVGREVLINQPDALVGSDGLRGLLDVPAATDQVDVSVLDASGGLVARYPLGPQAAGSVSFEWDGTDTDGNLVVPGAFQFVAEARYDGEATALSVTVPARVDSVSLTAAGTILNIAGVGPIPVSDVREFR